MKIFFLKNAEGKYFKSRGQSGYGPRWVDSMDKAKPYTKEGTAKGQITRWKTLFPEYPAPLLVECEVVVTAIRDLSEDIKDKRDKKLQALVNEANGYSEKFLSAPVPSSYKDRPTIAYRQELCLCHSRTVYIITKQFKDVSLNAIGLTHLKLRD